MSAGGRNAAIAFAVGLVVRVVYVFEISDSPTFHAPIVDALSYDTLARTLAGGGGLSPESFWQPFFYPVFLAAVYAVAGASAWPVRIAQVLVGATTCALSCRLATDRLGRQAGLVAGIVVAFYGPLVFYDGELLATGWAAFWSVVLVSMFDAVRRRPRVGLGLALGLLSGLAVLTRPTFLPFAVCAGALAAIPPRGANRSGVRYPTIAAAVAGFLLVCLPVAWLGQRATGRFSFLPASAGVNLHVGNNPRTLETLAIRPGWRWFELTQSPRFHGVERRQDTSRYFRDQVVRYAQTDPLGFSAGLVVKGVQLACSRELPRNVDVYVQRDASALLGALVWKVGRFGFPFGLLLPLALLGAIRHGRRFGVMMWLFLLCYGASIVLVFVTSRYRAPMVPVLAVAAAAGVLTLIELVRSRDWRRLGLALGGLGLVASLSSLPGPFPQEATDYRAERDYLLGRRAVDAGDAPRAVELLRAAIERDPAHADAHCALGAVLLGQGLVRDAEAEFAQTLRLDPGHAIAHGNMGRVLARRGDLAGAAHSLRLALEAKPWDAALRRDLDIVLARLSSSGGTPRVDDE